MHLREKLRVNLYADPASKVDFHDPEHSAIVREFRRAFGHNVIFTFANAEDVRSGCAFADKPHVFILPGIRDEECLFYKHIGPEGNKHIEAFVRSGGVFWGYCAGAYYAAPFLTYNGVDFKGEQSSELLGLLPTPSWGPIPGYCAKVSENRDRFPDGYYQVDPVPVIINNDGRAIAIEMPYGLGPAFHVPENSKINISARYNHISGNPPAAIDGPYHRGHVFLMGILPHYAYDHYPAMRDRAIPPSLENLRESMLIYNPQRLRYWYGQMHRIAAHHKLIAR